MAFQPNNNGMPDGSVNGGVMDGQFPGAPNMQASAVQTVTNEAARTLWYVYLLPSPLTATDLLTASRMGELDSWMDEQFIKTLYQNQTGNDVNVKIIRDRGTG